MAVETARVRSAWQGRISGCILGKPVEVLSLRQGLMALRGYLREADALPLRSYIPTLAGTLVDELGRRCCRDQILRAEPDDDINYTVLALMVLERFGHTFDTPDVARAWLQLLPAGMTWTAERAAYQKLLLNMDDEFVNGADAGFDLSICSDNDYNDWIGAQIRADLYGWVCPGRPALAADMARRDASLSHRGEGVHGAEFISALGAAVPATASLDEAMDVALEYIPPKCAVACAVDRGRQLAGQPDAVDRLHEEYSDLSPVHTLNNLALVVWALCSAEGDFSAAIGNAVAAGWDTDCNGATVGGLCGLSQATIPEEWTTPWQGRVAVTLAGCDELSLDDLVARTITVANEISGDAHVVH